jgi:DNA anti-recombination protein RmuC
VAGIIEQETVKKRSLSYFHFRNGTSYFIAVQRQTTFTMMFRKSFLIALFVLASIAFVSAADESFIDNAIRKLKGIFSRGAAKVDEAADKAASSAEDLKKNAENVNEQVKADVQETAKHAEKVTEEAKEKGPREIQEAVQEQAETVQEQVQEKIEEAQETVEKKTDEVKKEL